VIWPGKTDHERRWSVPLCTSVDRGNGREVPGRGIPDVGTVTVPEGLTRVRRFMTCWFMQSEADYYEVLQISRHADLETIHRVYRIMAARFHPDNPRTGDTDTFLLLKNAYEVLA